ncbi:hypothetical protein [Streptomyces sp. YIM S03343]
MNAIDPDNPSAAPTAATTVNEEAPPIQLHWNLYDVMYGDGDNALVLLSDAHLNPYFLELTANQAAALRRALAGPAGD